MLYVTKKLKAAGGVVNIFLFLEVQGCFFFFVFLSKKFVFKYAFKKFIFKAIFQDLQSTSSTVQPDLEIFRIKVYKNLIILNCQIVIFFRGLQDERTKKVIEEIKDLEYKLESKNKKVKKKFSLFFYCNNQQNS